MKNFFFALLLMCHACGYRENQFKGMWEIVHTLNLHNNRGVNQQFLTTNVMSIDIGEDFFGNVPNLISGPGSGVTNIEGIFINEMNSDYYINFITLDTNIIFDKPFKIVYLYRDSFLIRSANVEIKCKRWF